MNLYQGVLLSLMMGLSTWASTAHADQAAPGSEEQPTARERAVVTADERVQADKRMLFALGRLLAEDVDALNAAYSRVRSSLASGDRAQVAADRRKVLADEERVRHTQNEIVFWRNILTRDQLAAQRARDIAVRETFQRRLARRGVRPKVSSS
jgi:hypothetical protein